MGGGEPGNLAFIACSYLEIARRFFTSCAAASRHLTAGATTTTDRRVALTSIGLRSAEDRCVAAKETS